MGCNVKVYCAYFRDVERFEIKNYTVNCQMCVFYKRLKRENYGSDYVMHVNDTQSDAQNDTQSDAQSDTQSDAQSDTQGDTKGRLEEMIIRMIKKNSKISTADMAKELGVGIATVNVKLRKCRMLHLWEEVTVVIGRLKTRNWHIYSGLNFMI